MTSSKKTLFFFLQYRNAHIFLIYRKLNYLINKLIIRKLSLSFKRIGLRISQSAFIH